MLNVWVMKVNGFNSTHNEAYEYESRLKFYMHAIGLALYVKDEKLCLSRRRSKRESDRTRARKRARGREGGPEKKGVRKVQAESEERTADSFSSSTRCCGIPKKC